jgi:hypothetical protein
MDGCTNSCFCNADACGNAFCDDDSGSYADCSANSDCSNGEVCDVFDPGSVSGNCVTNPANNSCGGLVRRDVPFGAGVGRIGRMMQAGDFKQRARGRNQQGL